MGHTVTIRHIDKHLLRVSPWRGLRDLISVWVAVLAAAALADRLGSLSGHPVVAWVVGVVVIGVLQNGLSSLSHHAVHTNLHPNPSINDQLFRWLLAAPMGQNFLALRREHLQHHAHFAEPDDPERFYYDLELGRRNTVSRFLSWCALMFCGLVVVGQLRRVLFGTRDLATMIPEVSNQPARAERERREYLWILPSASLLFLLFWLLTGSPFGYPLFWALPLVTIGAGFNAMRATIEHAAPKQGGVYRTFLSGPAERFIVGPFNFDHHYEHHRFMTVPYYHVGHIRTLLSEARDYQDCTLERSYRSRFMTILHELHRRTDASHRPDRSADHGVALT